MMQFRQVVLDFLGVNCYLLWNPSSMRGLILDPGSSSERIFAAVSSCGFTPEAVLLSHAHVDHIGRVPEVCEKYGIPVWLHADDLPIYRSTENHLKPWADAVEGLPAPMAGACPTAGMNLQVLHTPGHTPGGCCYYFPEEKQLFSGDTMFQGTYGRTDFPGGSYSAILKSIRTKLLTLPGDVQVHPGHGADTTIAAEASLYPAG